MDNKPKYKLHKRFRIPTWDYSENGYYFVTICSKDHKNHFGKIVDSKMYLSEIGKIAEKDWLEIPNHFKDVFLDEWIIMPDHLHGIVVIYHDYINNPEMGRNAPWRVPTGIQPLVNNSLSAIINHFKGAVTRYCHKNNFYYFAWQSRFYDHIIHSEKSLYNIREYIKNNPIDWKLDRNNPRNLFI